MATFKAKAFEKKLNGMDLSQTSVQTVSLWIIHHKQNIKDVLGVWVDMMKKAKIDRKLVLFYLANDVVQNSRKKSKDFVMFFGKALKETINHLNDKKVNSQVERVLKIWEERRVYEKEFVEKLRALHTGGKKEKPSKSSESIERKDKTVGRKEEKIVEKPEKPAKPKTPVKPLPPDFKMSTVMNMIVSMKEIESEISTHDSQMASLKVDASDLEAVKQVKDRSGVNRFVKEFEDSNEKLDVYCNTLSKCINDKRVLIDMLHHSENYYDAAYEEAKVIVHAYKTFGSRLTSMKRKVESKVKKLKTKWEKEQKEKEEQKNTKHEYELEPISDADEPSEFQPIGDLLQSGLKSLAEKKKDEMYRPEDPTVDKLDVLDMDLGSDSDGGTPDGPLYDPSSVLYDPNDPGKDSADGSQQSLENSDGQNSSNINIPNPEDVFKNIVGQNEMSMPLQPMGIMIDGKLQTFSLADGNAIAGISTNSNVMQLNTSSMRSKKKSNIAVKETTRSFLNNEAVSPISEDSVPSPEGTPEDLVLEKDNSQNNSFPNQLGTQHQGNMTNILQSTQVLPTVLPDGQMIIGDQLVTVGQDNWALLTNQAPIQLDSLQGFQPAGIQDLPPPPMMQGFPNLLNPGQQLSFDPQTQAFLGDQAAMGNPLGQLAQASNLLGQLGMQVGGMQVGGIALGQPEIAMQLPVSGVLPQVSVGASTTPTLDESLDKSVRPIDILSQLLNKGGKSKKGSSEKDKSYSGEKDKEHRSRDHGKHRRSSTSKRRSVDRHHSSEHREGSSERHESGHSSKKSHHRRKSRGRSKEKRSHSTEKSDTQRQFSIDSYDDASVDSYMKSPKVSRLQSLSESFDDGAESRQEAGERDRSKSNSSDSTKDEEIDKPSTIFDQRRQNRAEQTSEAQESQSQLQRRDNVATDAPGGEVSKGNTDIVQQDANAQFTAQNTVFLQHQQSFDGQQILNPQFNQQMLNPAMSLANSQQWTPEVTLQNQQGFVFDSLRSPTPEMDQFKNMTQNQQSQMMDPNFQQSSQFSHMQLQQQAMQQGGLSSMPMMTSQGPLTISPNIPVSVDMRPTFPPSFQADQSREQNIEQGGFRDQQIVEQPQMMQGDHLQMQGNQHANQHVMHPERQQTMQEQDQFNPGEGLLPSPQQSPIEPRLRMPAPTGSGRFRPVEAQMVSNLRFLRPQQNSPEQSSMRPPLWHDSQSPRHESPMHHPERPPFRPNRPGLRHQRPDQFGEGPPFNRQRNPVSPFRPNFQPDFERQDMSKPSTGRQGSEEDPETETNQTFDSRPGQNVEQRHRLSSRSPMPQDRNKRFQNFEQDVPDYSQDEAIDFSEGNKPNLTVIKTIDNDDNSINGEFEGQERQEDFQGFQPNQKNIRPPIPRGGLMHPQRNRFRHHEPNTFHRGPRPMRMGRPTGFQQQQQRHRFRPPLRPRMPQGYAPRRPVF